MPSLSLPVPSQSQPVPTCPIPELEPRAHRGPPSAAPQSPPAGGPMAPVPPQGRGCKRCPKAPEQDTREQDRGLQVHMYIYQYFRKFTHCPIDTAARLCNYKFQEYYYTSSYRISFSGFLP